MLSRGVFRGFCMTGDVPMNTSSDAGGGDSRLRGNDGRGCWEWRDGGGIWRWTQDGGIPAFAGMTGGGGIRREGVWGWRAGQRE